MKQLVRTRSQLGAALRRRRKQLQVTQASLGEKVHLRQASISNLESGESGTNLATLFDLLSALDLELIVQSRTKSDAADIERLFK